MGSHQRVLSTSDTMRLMFPKDDSDKNKLDMPPYAQPLLAPFVPKIKMFTFRNFMDIESEINDCSEVTIQIILAKMLCSCSEEVGKGGMASSPRSLCYLGTAFHKFTRGCEQEGYGRHSASRSRGTVNAPLTPQHSRSTMRLAVSYLYERSRNSLRGQIQDMGVFLS